MSERHDSPILPPPLATELFGDQLRVTLPDGPSATFRHLWVPTLTLRAADEIAGAAPAGLQQPVFVSYRRASAEARKALRDAGISFAGDDGRAFVRAIGMLVDRDDLVERRTTGGWELEPQEQASSRNPFAKRSSRVPRWLLLHHEQVMSVGELAKAVKLNPAAVSRLVRALEDAALLREVDSHNGGRRRDIRLERPRALLDLWLPSWERRRVRHYVWDIGARDAENAIALLAAAGEAGVGGWAIGGIAGAAAVRRAVEPGEVLVWVDGDAVAALADQLQPAPGRGGRGLVRLAVAPDPWVLGLAHDIDSIPISDPVQLWLDCASEGERALEAAEAIADAAGWT